MIATTAITVFISRKALSQLAGVNGPMNTHRLAGIQAEIHEKMLFFTNTPEASKGLLVTKLKRI